MSMLRMQVVETHPFWGSLLLHVRLVPSIGLGAIAATDCVRTIWYDPLLTEHLDLDELGFVLLHEVGHHVLESMDRSRGRDRHLWNCATDYAINRIIARIERPWPRGAPMYRPPSGDHPVLGKLGCLLDPQYDGMIAEMIYERLVHDDLPPSSTTTLRIDGVEVPGVQDHGGGIDVHLPVNLDEEDREQLRARVGEALEAWRSAEGRGDVAGGLDRAFDLDRRSTVPWRRLLARYSGQALGARSQAASSRSKISAAWSRTNLSRSVIISASRAKYTERRSRMVCSCWEAPSSTAQAHWTYGSLGRTTMPALPI